MSARVGTRIERYVEAVRTLRALEQAERDEPNLRRRSAIIAARVALKNAEAELNGSMLGAARRALTAVRP